LSTAYDIDNKNQTNVSVTNGNLVVTTAPIHQNNEDENFTDDSMMSNENSSKPINRRELIYYASADNFRHKPQMLSLRKSFNPNNSSHVSNDLDDKNKTSYFKPILQSLKHEFIKPNSEIPKNSMHRMHQDHQTNGLNGPDTLNSKNEKKNYSFEILSLPRPAQV
jgi:hypothetical protein